MFSLQDLCRKNTFFLPSVFTKHTLHLLGLYWKGHGSIQRIQNVGVLIQHVLLLSINAALFLAGEEGNNVVLQLLLLWEGNLHYAIIRALWTAKYGLLCVYHTQIQDWHVLLPLFQDPETFEKCHVLCLVCVLSCLLQHAVQYIMLSILVIYTEDLLYVLFTQQIQGLFILPCANRKLQILTWMGQNLPIPVPVPIFIIAVVTKDLQMFSLRYKIVFVYMENQGLFHLSQVLRMVMLYRHFTMVLYTGLLPFVLEILQHGGHVYTALSYAVTQNTRKILHHVVRQKNVPHTTIARMLHLAVQKHAPRKTLYLLLSYIYYKVQNVTKLLQHVLQYNSTLVLRILLQKKKNLLDATLSRYVKDSTYFRVQEFMQDFSISPEKFITIPVREQKNVLFKAICADIWENPAERIRNLMQILCTIQYASGRQFLLYIIHTIYQSYSLQPAEILILATFYVKHNATTHFTDLCKYLWLYRGTESTKLFLQCLEIAVTKEFPVITSIVCVYIIYLFTAGAITKEEIMRVYALEYAMYLISEPVSNR
uniref:p505_7R n=1 Tax=African swine fever virus TaxID=10497 RepID=A0A6G7KTR7_ASF